MRSRNLWSLFFAVLVGSTSVMAHEPAEPSFHFVVTGGLRGLSDGNRAFLSSPLFRMQSLDSGNTFRIKNANLKAFRYRNTYFVSRGLVTGSDLRKGDGFVITASGESDGIVGAQLFGVTLSKDTWKFSDFDFAPLTRRLGAIKARMKWETRTINGEEVLALVWASESNKIEWPDASSDIDEVLSVFGEIGGESNKHYLFFPRQVASTERVFGIVDDLLKKTSKGQYVDLGDALLSSDFEDIEHAKKLQQIILARNPAVMGSSIGEYRAFWLDSSLMGVHPYVSSIVGEKMFPSVREIQNKSNVQFAFAALPYESPLLGLVTPEGSTQKTFGQILAELGSSALNPSTLVIGMAQDSKSAARAIESPVFDAVLSLVSSQSGALPSYDEIDLTRNHEEGLRSVAPLVRVSSLDVTEVIGYLDQSGRLSKIIIKRHAVLDSGPVAKDAAEVLDAVEESHSILTEGLPSRALVAVKGDVYTESELNQVLGGLLKEVKAATDIAIVEMKDEVTPIESGIPLVLAESLLNDRGRAVWLSIRGKYLKRIFKAIKENQFDLNVTVVGGTIKGPTIGEREVPDNELYRVVVSEKVFFAIDRFMARENLFSLKNLPSNALQAAMLESDKETLKILSEVRKRDMRDDPSIGDSKTLYATSIPIAELIDAKLLLGVNAERVTQLLRRSSGQISRSLILNISDLDFGLKINTVNDNLALWQTEARAENANPGFPEPRFTDPVYSQKLIYAKAGIKYIGKVVEADIGTNIKFFQPNTEGEGIPTRSDIPKIKPAKDSVRLEGGILIPFRRVFDEPPLGFWDLGALLRVSYDTQIWPNSWLTKLPSTEWPFRVNDLRVLAGLSLKPIAAGETMHVGGVIDYDFSRNSSLQAFGLGFEIGGQGSWNVGSIGIKVDSTIRQLFPIASPEPSRMGLVWTVDGKASVPIYGGFSFSLVANTILGTRMESPLTPGYSVLFGFALSYSDYMKWSF